MQFEQHHPGLHLPLKSVVFVLLCTALLAGCASFPKLNASPDEAELRTEADAKPDAAEDILQQAMRAAQPRQSKLQRARSLLEKLLAAEDPDSRALHPYARTLLQQIDERQRLTGLNERLSRQLARSEGALKDSTERNGTLQQKIDALTEIERSLAPRTPAPTLPR